MDDTERKRLSTEADAILKAISKAKLQKKSTYDLRRKLSSINRELYKDLPQLPTIPDVNFVRRLPK